MHDGTLVRLGRGSGHGGRRARGVDEVAHHQHRSYLELLGLDLLGAHEQDGRARADGEDANHDAAALESEPRREDPARSGLRDERAIRRRSGQDGARRYVNRQPQILCRADDDSVELVPEHSQLPFCIWGRPMQGGACLAAFHGSHGRQHDGRGCMSGRRQRGDQGDGEHDLPAAQGTAPTASRIASGHQNMTMAFTQASQMVESSRRNRRPGALITAR